MTTTTPTHTPPPWASRIWAHLFRWLHTLFSSPATTITTTTTPPVTEDNTQTEEPEPGRPTPPINRARGPPHPPGTTVAVTRRKAPTPLPTHPRPRKETTPPPPSRPAPRHRRQPPNTETSTI